MPTMNNPIWSSLWQRAAKEPIGIAFRVDKVFPGFFSSFAKSRPEIGCEGFTFTPTPDPNLFYITRPGAVIEDEIPD